VSTHTRDEDCTDPADSTLDVILANYFQAHSPVTASKEGRITNSTQTTQQIPGKGGNSGGAAASLPAGMQIWAAAGLMIGTGIISMLL
jgi:hypothetical protein